MATFRVGLGSFNINDGAVGIGTEGSGHGNLRVEGTTRVDTNLDVIGVSTFARYSGFTAEETNVNNRELTLSGETSSIGDIIVEDNATLTVGLGSTACAGSLEYICVKHHFSAPSGDTDQRNEVSGYSEGSVRYNFDLATMEFFNGSVWKQFNYQVDTGSRNRAIFFGGYYEPGYGTGSNGLQIEYFQMATTGTEVNFGTYSSGRTNTAGSASETRAISSCGYNGPGTTGSSNEIEYVTIASKGNAIDFGNRATVTGYGGQAVASSTRSVFVGSRDAPANRNVIDYVEIATIGDALDFGDLVANGGYKGSAASPIRGFVAGGSGPLGNSSNDIQMITIASKGNATEIGDLPRKTDNVTGVSNSIRGIFSGGYHPTSPTTINGAAGDLFHLNLATQGNAFYFGDLTVGRQRCGAATNQTRAFFVGGFSYPGTLTIQHSVDAVTIASSGSAVNFTTLERGKHQFGGTSDCHGGLGGY